MVITTQLSSPKFELRFCAGSHPARVVSEIRKGEDLWQWSQLEIRLDAFRRLPVNIHLNEDVLKTSWRRFTSSSSEGVFKTSSRRLDQNKYIHFSNTSSEDVFKTSWSRRIYSSWWYVFKTSCKNVFKTSCQDFLKMSLRRL